MMPVAGELAVVAPVMVHVRVESEQLSLTVGLGVTTEVLQLPAVVLTDIGVGQVTDGASVSVTVTVNEQVLLFPAASATVYFTVVMPELKL